MAQWYGFESVPGFSEAVSAFSPEDLYSNLLGARIAVNLILTGHAASETAYNTAMSNALPVALHQLDALPAEQTRAHFERIDGRWWDSRCRVPQKFLVLKRNYDIRDQRSPLRPDDETAPVQRLTLPQTVGSVSLAQISELRLWPGRSMERLPAPHSFYRLRDFPMLAARARASDTKRLADASRGCE